MWQPHRMSEIPAETKKVAQAAFPNGSLVMSLRDELGSVYADDQFQDLFPDRGQPAQSPALLAFVTILQFAEGMSDRQAADAVRGRIDWKYALGLELTDPGFDFTVLCEFRARLVADGAEDQLLTLLLKHFQQRGLIKSGGRRFDSFHLPESRDKSNALTQQIGTDGYQLMTQAFAIDAPDAVRHAPSLEIWRQIWIQQYSFDPTDAKPGPRLRDPKDLPPAEKRIRSPYDLDARYARHTEQEWVGYRTHLTETCDPDAPLHLITQVETVLAPIQDVDVTETIQTDLAQEGLKPKEHYLDAAYLSANLLAKAAGDEGIEVIGPVTKLQDVSWQAREKTGYDISHFQIDWEGKRVTCPQGQTSSNWSENAVDATGNAVIHVAFPTVTCQARSARAQCTRSKSEGRNMQFRPRAQFEALQKARAEQVTDPFRAKYRPRLGIEGTVSQAVRAFELRETRYFGLAKMHLQGVALAAGINLSRFYDYLCGTGLVQAKPSPFVTLTA